MTNTLYVKGYGQYAYDSANTQMAAVINFTVPNNLYNGGNPVSPIAIEFTGGTENPSATPYPLFHSVASAVAYYGPTAAGSWMTTLNTLYGTSYYTAYDVELIDSPVLDAITHISYNALLDKPTLFDGDYNNLFNKPTLPSLSAGAHIADAANNGATNASTTQVTNYNTLSGLLGIATGLNDANTAQNDLATKYNALAGKYNDLATKFNTLLDRLEANGLLATS